MKKIIVIILLAAISISTYGQTREYNDTLPSLHKKYEKRFKELQIENQPVLNTYKAEYGINPVKNYNLPDSLTKSYSLNFPKLKIYDGPPVLNSYDAKTPYTYIQSPTSSFSFVYDYNYSGAYKLSDQLYITSVSNQESIPSIGSMRFTNPKLTYIPADWMQVSAGGFASKYNLSGNSFNDIGYNGEIKFIPHDRIRFNIFGQYSVYSRSNMNNLYNTNGPVNVGGPIMHMTPQTYYGGSIEFKVTEKFGIQGGIVRELNPMTGKWENNRFIAPVFYGK